MKLDGELYNLYRSRIRERMEPVDKEFREKTESSPFPTGQAENQRVNLYAREIKTHTRKVADIYVSEFIKIFREIGRYPDQEDIDRLGKEINCIPAARERQLIQRFSGALSSVPETIVNAQARALKGDLESEIGQAWVPLNTFITEGKLETVQNNANHVLQLIFKASANGQTESADFHTVLSQSGLPEEDFRVAIQHLAKMDLIKQSANQSTITKLGMEQLNKIARQPVSVEHLDTVMQASPPIDFSFVANDDLRKIIERDYEELRNQNPIRSPKSVLVISGSVIEGLLIDALITNGDYNSPSECGSFLKDLIKLAVKVGITPHDNLNEILRVFRNIIHPAREIKDGLRFDSSHAEHSRAAVGVIISDVRTWYANRPK